MSSLPNTSELRELLTNACIEGPASLQHLLLEKGLTLATEFNGAYENSLLYEVLQAVVIHGASLSVLDVLERQWPRLEFRRNRNGLTELVMLEHDLRKGNDLFIDCVDYPPLIGPNDELRASINAAVRDVMQRMGAFDPERIEDAFFYCNLPCNKDRTTIRHMILNNSAYYVYEAFPDSSFQEFASYFLFPIKEWYTRPCRLHIVAQDTIVRLASSAPHEELKYVYSELMLGYQQIWERGCSFSNINAAYHLNGVIHINLNLTRQELRKRCRRMAFLGMYQPVIDPQTRARSMRWNFPREVFDLVADMLCDF